LTILAFVFTVLCPRPTLAASTGMFSSPDSFLVKVQETIQYFFAFKAENKVSVLEKQAEKRLVAAQDYAVKENKEKIQSMLQGYQLIKDKQNNFLGKIEDKEVLGAVAERTINQQKIMEEIKTKTNNTIQQEVVQVQEQVVNQVAKRVVDVNGTQEATEFLNGVAHVWAPGTKAGGGEAGVVYEGGGKLIYAPGTGPGGQAGVVIEGGEMKFAPGTSGGGPSGADIKTVEVKTGGGSNEEAPVNNSGSNLAPGTTQGGGGGNTIDPGGVDPGDPGTSN